MATGGPENEIDEPQEENAESNGNEDWNYAGLEAIDRACLEIYPDQPNPLQATALVKMWLGGPDPLDYISIYSNSGDLDRGIPPHWHYVSCGFSDLHGDGRVHTFAGSGQSSGFGFELTMRLKKQNNEAAPPMWPPGLMNRLAKYVFQTGNVLQEGDHIPWHKPLDEAEDSRSLIQHLLVTKDPQLPEITTPYGYLDFRQLVGVTDDEMKAAQKWKGTGVLELMTGSKEVGPFYITDIERGKSIFETDSNLMHQVSDGINTDGSNLGHVTAVCMWADINASLTNGKDLANEIIEEEEPEPLEGVHLMFDSEAADLLPVVVRGRLQKGRLFVFQNAEGQAVHLVPPGCHEEGLFVNQTEPLKALGGYLQVYCSHSLLDRMALEIECLAEGLQENQHYPKEFRFSDPTILITVYPRGHLFDVVPSS